MKAYFSRTVRLCMALGAVCVTVCVSQPLEAQTGRIVGRVIDQDRGTPLPGAVIDIEGTNHRATAGLDGRYSLSDVPPGLVVLRVRMLGFAAKTVSGVVVPETGAVEFNVTLAPRTLRLETITVVSAEAERGSVSRAIEEQRMASNIISGVSAEQISRSPDGDAAAAAQRVSGVTVQDGRFVFVRGLGERYTTASLNGSRIPSPEPERKMVPLDLFPAGLLQSISTSKTFTPNLPGDFSGAHIDIRTREYPAGREASLSFSLGYNSVTTGKGMLRAPTAGGEWLASSTEPRLIPDVVLNNTTPRPGTQTNDMVNAMRNAWSVNSQTGRPNPSVALSLGGTDGVLGHRVGYLFSTVYSLSDEANIGTIRESIDGDHYTGDVGRQSVLLGGLLNLSTLLGSHTRISLNNGYNRSADNEARLERGFYENHSTNIQIERLKYVERTVRQNQLAVQHQLARQHRLDWSVSLSSVSRQEPDRSEFITWIDPEVPTWYNQEGAFRAYGGLTEDVLEASADYQFELGGARSPTLKLGGLTRTTARKAFDAGYAIRTREWSPSDPRWQLPPEAIFDGRFSQNGETLFELGIFNAGGNYEADDHLVAGYVMLEWSPFPGVRVIGGARLERSELELGYEDVLGTRGVVEPSYSDILPAASVVLDLTETQKLRFSVSQTLARPEYREIAPICYRAGLGEEQRCGNPDLRRTLIRNFDFRWELYPNDGEVLSLALFAKRFTDPIEPRYQGRSGTNSLWFQNAERAANYGVEVEAVRNLGFLSWHLESFSAFTNATFMRSTVHTGIEGDPDRAMTGQAPYVVNAGMTWSAPDGSPSATILYNVVGERIINARSSGQTIQDMLEMPRPSLDLSLRFPAFGPVSGKLDLENVLDSPHEVRQGDLMRAYYKSGRGASVGFSWRL